LFLLPAAAAVALALRNYHLDVATVTLLVTAAVGLPVAWLTWAIYREGRPPPTPVGGLTVTQVDEQITQVTDQLAVEARAQWKAEDAVRRLYDPPYRLPVSWDPADPSLTGSWDSLVKLASSGAGWPPPPPAGTWAAGPDGLAGSGGDLREVLARVPTGRLVVLGEPGAGKTTLMVRLVRDLLDCWKSGDPVPILASIASWNPADEDKKLWDWLAAQLAIDHPGLAAAPPPGRGEPTQAAALLASGLILPVLDGLDEIPEEVRGLAISKINDALAPRPGQQLVVTCRSQDYRDAVRPPNGVEVTLRGAAAVQLRPLDAEAVRSYLREDAGGPDMRARWDPVVAMLGTDTPAGRALETPLMVGLARAIYNQRPGELAGAPRDPAELCNPALADRAAVESLLFDEFIPAAYRNAAARWEAGAEKWLMFLARHLDRTINGPDLAWWQLRLAVPGIEFAFQIVLGVLRGLLIGALAGGLTGGLTWILYGAVFGGGVAGVVVGIVVGIVVAIAVGLNKGREAVEEGPPTLNVRAAFSGATSPATMLARDRSQAIGDAFGAGISFGALAGALVAFGAGVKAGVAAAIGVALIAWVVGCAGRSAWLYYELARIWLALRHRLPWSFMGFLAGAHRRGVLRQAGVVYQFRHIELQHRLATRPSNPPASSSMGS
jgi:hypothetical protein